MASKTKVSETKKIDYLDEDEPISNQLWVCVSFLSPEGIKNCSLRGLKVRGVFATREKADARAKYLQKIDPDFDVFVGEMGKWLPWDPDPHSIEDNVHANEELNNIMKGYKDNRKRTKEMEEERKRDMIKKAAINEQSRLKDNKAEHRRERLKKKLQARQQQAANEKEKTKAQAEQISGIRSLESQLKTDEESVQKGKEELKDMTKLINEKEKNISTLDNKLEQIQALYNKMKEEDNEDECLERA